MAKNKAKKPPVVEKAAPGLRQTMAKPMAGYTVAADLRTLMVNAKRLGRDDVWRDAFRRLCVLEGADQTDPLHRDFYEMLAAYEHLLSERNARATPGNADPAEGQEQGRRPPARGVGHEQEDFHRGVRTAGCQGHARADWRAPRAQVSRAILGRRGIAAAKARVELVPAG